MNVHWHIVQCAQAISDMLTVPGASATVLEARVPYAASALALLLGCAPERCSSEETATRLAQAAYRRAAALTLPGEGPLLGVSCTAALRTVRCRRTPD
jgi:hypothetical protein